MSESAAGACVAPCLFISKADRLKRTIIPPEWAVVFSLEARLAIYRTMIIIPPVNTRSRINMNHLLNIAPKETPATAETSTKLSLMVMGLERRSMPA